MKRRLSKLGVVALALAFELVAPPVRAGEYVVAPIVVDELKSVFGRVESRNLVAARARIGGSLLSIDVAEGTNVQAGQVIAVVGDEKLKLRLDAVDASVRSLAAQLGNARSELARGEQLFQSGIIAKARIDQLRTQVDVLAGQLGAETAERAVIVQQAREGQVLAPATGRVLKVPVTPGTVVLPGETVATVAGGGYFLRIALPERHASRLSQGSPVLVGERGMDGGAGGEAAALRSGKLAKVYPELENGFVLADIEVEGLGEFFVGERTLVWVPVDKRRILAVPPSAIAARSGIDYVRIARADASVEVAVVPGQRFDTSDGPRIEILSGLAAGDRVVLP